MKFSFSPHGPLPKHGNVGKVQGSRKLRLLVSNIQNFGWNVSKDNIVTFEWDSDANITAINNNVAYLTRGCGCKTGCGSSCGCRKKKKLCGPGCKCDKNKCKNLSINNEGISNSSATTTNIICTTNDHDANRDLTHSQVNYQSVIEELIENDSESEEVTNGEDSNDSEGEEVTNDEDGNLNENV